MKKPALKPFEKSGKDDDKGVKEGSRADRTRDLKEMRANRSKPAKKGR